MSEPETTPPANARRARWRTPLWALLLAALIVLLVTHDGLRRDAATSARTAARAVLIDGLGLSPRDTYVLRLRMAGLYDRPLGQRWRNAPHAATPDQIDRRLRTNARFNADTIRAAVYTFDLERGERLAWQLARRDTGDGHLFATLEYRDTADDDWHTVTELLANDRPDGADIDRDGRYRVVLQPELGAAVDYRLALAAGGSLHFPVQGAALHDIGSGFGAPRDGGSRAHHGVDIFADRGTPVRAVADGRVRTGTQGIGGNHIWLSSGAFGAGARYYYAHLNSFDVDSGARVTRGEVIGHVGNTGNARTTPPHLHFGIYTAGGPVDPAPFLRPAPRLPDE